MISGNVMPRRCRPTAKSYRAAIKAILLALQAQHGLNQRELADRLGCSAGTIKNALNEAGNLDGVTLANIEYEFGPSALDPFLELGGSRAIPRATCTGERVDPALALSQALPLVIEAQRPDSDDGANISPGECRLMRPQLVSARQSLDVLIERAEAA